jgi:hypothetical protein
MLNRADVLQLHEIARAIQQDVPRRGRPRDEGGGAESDQVVPKSLVRGTRGYIERVVDQINGAFERGWFDACAVMIRRLVEMVIIEAFESKGIAHKIKTSSGDFLYLSDLIDSAMNEPSWNLGRNTKRALPQLKGVGDRSAHSRRFTAHLRDIEKHIDDLRDVVQEFIYLAGLK